MINYSDFLAVAVASELYRAHTLSELRDRKGEEREAIPSDITKLRPDSIVSDSTRRSTMASVMMGLRRRVPVNNGCSTTNGGISSASTSSNKRSRTENNNSPSHGNLNSLTGGQGEPPAKKSRSTGSGSTRNSAPGASEALGTKSRGGSGRGGSVSKSEGPSKAAGQSGPANWPVPRSSFSSVAALPLATGQPTMSGGGNSSSSSLGAGSAIPYMTPSVTPSVATFVGNATNLNKNTAVSYLDISNMTSAGGGSIGSTANAAFASPNNAHSPAKNASGIFRVGIGKEGPAKKFQNDTMFNAYQPWVIKTYGDLAKTKTITIKKYARILRTLRGEEANSAENSKFRFWVKSKGFHIGQPDGYDAKPADRIVGRHAVTSPGLDPPLYVPTQPPHNKALNGAEGTVPPGRVYKKVAIVENFFDIIHAVHVDLEGRPGKHAGQKRTYRTITETYAFLPREAVTRFLLGCTECQRRPRTPSPTNLSAQSQTTPLATSATPPSPTPATALSASPVQTSQRPREASHAPEGKSLFNYRHPKHPKDKPEQDTSAAGRTGVKDKEEKYNPLSISNLLKKDPPVVGFPTATTITTTTTSTESLAESRRTPESDRASSRSSASSKRRRMLPEGRTPSPPPSAPLARPWSPSIDPKDTPIDYSLPITTTYLKHQQRLLAEKTKLASKTVEGPAEDDAQVANNVDTEALERERFSPAAGLIDTNLNLLATIQHLHCQVMLALTERLRPAVVPSSLALPQASSILASSMLHPGISIPSIINQNHS
ncbi:uncharacterized protein LOC124177873 isoform X1 [Neodiprion fabricii]|uniref:uncharacterized protein LOC124177873 isoform X1 n=1 Tax=Neodiprion fabricii TaxID=2872261 RepID=UPI001ED95E1C|nr:uncharacterized protein LOC124177873 isoform X1 [Neodiprion fabricii]XP_046416726.1 uncharacterized protein LOC124177873 isoform X1 [Neodiprion fabricii]